MNSLNIGVHSWIIRDGNYSDFKVGQKTQFAFEFFPLSLTSTVNDSASITEIKLNEYRICGQIVYSSKNVWVVDFGFLAYQEVEPPKYAVKGSWVEGEISLNIDPFFYFEYLKNLPEMPRLTYKIRIENILLETTPWVELPNGKMVVRDKENESFREVVETDAWNDDNGCGNYILKCVAYKT